MFKSIISVPLLAETCASTITNKTKISFNYIIKDKLSDHLIVKKKLRIINTVFAMKLLCQHTALSTLEGETLIWETNSGKSFSCPHVH